MNPVKSLLFLDRHLLHHIALPDRVHYILAHQHLAKHGVPAVQVRLRRVGNEELAAVGVGARVSHRDDPGLVLQWVILELILEPVARTTRARTGWVAAL